MVYIVALGNGFDKDKELTVESRMSALAASYLFKKGLENKLIFSGGHTKGKQNLSEAEKMYDYSRQSLSLDIKDVILEEHSIDTAGNAGEVKRYLSEKDSVILVSFGFHLRRARLIFENYGINVKNQFSSERTLKEDYSAYKELIKEFNLLRKIDKLLREMLLIFLVCTIDPKGKILRIITSRTRN